MFMLSFEQFNEQVNKSNYTDFNAWKSDVLAVEPKAIVTLEDNSSHYYIASKPGSAEMVGKFQLNGSSKTTGTGYLYPKYAAKL